MSVIRLATSVALLLPLTAFAKPTIAERCPAGARALVLRIDGTPPQVVLDALGTEVAVEAERLGFTACWSAETPGATATVGWTEEGVTLATASLDVDPPRALNRVVPTPQVISQSAVLELSVLLGDLLRDAIAPVQREAPPPPKEPATEPGPWAARLSSSYRGAPAYAGHLLGAELGLAYEWSRVDVELTLGGSAGLTQSAPAGRVTPAAGSAGLSLGVAVYRGASLTFGARAGLVGWAVRFLTSATAPAVATEQWAPALSAAIGLELSWRVRAFGVFVRGSGLVPLIVAVARADGTNLVGVGGLGFAVTLGVQWNLGS